jgi:hypothetical protein
VIGLATIFPGAFWPVVIMGGVLEVGKLVTASWLYRNWQFTKWLLRTYLTIAVVILSLITSMGIFGFLSKAHLEQNLAEDTVTQRIEIITNKIASENTYIERQKDTITRAETTLNRTTDSNTGALDIEIQGLKDAESKFKTLLAVETNTVKDLNARLRTLDKDVSDVLTANKQFFNEERAAAELKASQKEERDQIAKDIADAQARIQILKDDYAQSTANIQKRIDTLRQSNVTDNSGVNAEITKAEANILAAQNRIDGLILEREPLQSQMLKLEAEVGPVKYIAALAVDFGWTDSVNTSEAVRWVILIIIVVFDPLAVLLLIAANQSLIRRFPPEAPKPQEIIDLEKPDLDSPPFTGDQSYNKADISGMENLQKMEKMVSEWQQKLDKFNQHVGEPKEQELEIVPVNKKSKTNESLVSYDLGSVISNNQDLKPQDDNNRSEIEDNKGFDPDEVKYDMDPVVNPEWEDKLPEKLKESDRIKPDLTEVIEPEAKIEDKKSPTMGTLGQRLVDNKGKVVSPPKPALKDPKSMTDQERTAMLNLFHQQHGKFQDISDVELKNERDASNRAQFLEDVNISEQDAKGHPPITESRMAFFQDHIDDILRGDTTAENLPEELRKTLAVLMSDYDNPSIIEKGSAIQNNAVEQTGLATMTSNELKEHFSIDPVTEDRDITDEELDELLDGSDEQPDQSKISGRKKLTIKDGKRVFVPVEEETYHQNQEQEVSNNWSKIKELDLPEPGKNELILPDLASVGENEIVDLADKIDIENVLPKEKIIKHKNKMLTDEQYREKIEQRINDYITKIESGEINLSDLDENDQKIILELMKENNE